jgi:phosphate transport system protein
MLVGARSHFEKRLAELNDDVLHLGGLARQAVIQSFRALENGDADQAREVIARDADANRLRYEIEGKCYALIATEQPVAGDLRAIVSALTIATDLERIADHGKKIARIYLRMLENPRSVSIAAMPRLAELAVALVDRALRSFARRDTTEAEAVCRDDDQVDALYKQTFNVLLSYMLEKPPLIGQCTHLLQVAHELERVGDRATNIGERVIYAVTGELIELNQ